MSVQDRQEQIVKQMAAMTSEQRFAYVVMRGKSHKEMHTLEFTDADLVEGCATKTWVKIRVEGGRLYLQIDSESKFIRGVLSLFVEMYNDAPCEDVNAHPPAILRDCGISAHLSPNKRQGLSNVWASIANACQI